MASDKSALIVYILDDDDAVRDGLARLLRSAGLDPRPYATAEGFLEAVSNASRSCVLLDISMPKMSGPQVQACLNQRGITLPVITLSARDDARARAWTHELGARMFLRKPVDGQALLDAINWVCQAD